MLHVWQLQKQGSQNYCAYSIYLSQVKEMKDRKKDLLQTPKEESNKIPSP